MKIIRPRLNAHRFLRILATIVIGYLVFLYFTLPGPSIITLQDHPPSMSSLMRIRWEEAGGDMNIQYHYVPLDRISKNFVRAVIAVEDGGFYRHSGIDYDALERAYKRNLRSGRVRFGGSTITMQLAKNLFLSNDRSYIRKVKEAVITLRLERYLSKKRILELYLNVIELGPGIFGVEAASQHYFHKPAAHLTKDESIRLAAIIASPLRHSPFEESRFMSIRKNIILRKIGG
ncbi:MAG: monofunctional biosynthetic peptidoglycan transglycosylase [Bacteroidota bacterium]|nr:monofunctional biosynthetic peptidoglycan transglycosylase [Bacteroidota bacterium]